MKKQIADGGIFLIIIGIVTCLFWALGLGILFILSGIILYLTGRFAQ